MATRRGTPKKRPRRRSPGHRPQKARLLTLEELKRLPSPPPKTTEQEEERAERIYSLAAAAFSPSTFSKQVFGPGSMGHELHEAARQLRLEDIKRELRASPDKAKPRGKLTAEVWRVHFEKHPKPLSANQRRKLLAAEQNVHVDRSTVARRLKSPPP